MRKLIHIAEPRLRFGYAQSTEDPRDGLMLFGPLAKGNVFGIRAGVVGTPEGIRRFKQWVKRIQSPILCARTLAESLYTSAYPGFHSVFQIPWHPDPVIEVSLETDRLKEVVLLADRQQRVFQTVDLYATKILESRSASEKSSEDST